MLFSKYGSNSINKLLLFSNNIYYLTFSLYGRVCNIKTLLLYVIIYALSSKLDTDLSHSKSGSSFYFNILSIIKLLGKYY